MPLSPEATCFDGLVTILDGYRNGDRVMERDHGAGIEGGKSASRGNERGDLGPNDAMSECAHGG